MAGVYLKIIVREFRHSGRAHRALGLIPEVKRRKRKRRGKAEEEEKKCVNAIATDVCRNMGPTCSTERNNLL